MEFGFENCVGTLVNYRTKEAVSHYRETMTLLFRSIATLKFIVVGEGLQGQWFKPHKKPNK